MYHKCTMMELWTIMEPILSIWLHDKILYYRYYDVDRVSENDLEESNVLELQTQWTCQIT